LTKFLLEHQPKPIKEPKTLITSIQRALQTLPAFLITCVESQVAAVNRLFGDRQPDAAIECTGSVDAVRLSLLSCKPGGCLITVGRGRVREMPLPLAQTAVVREVEIRGVFRYANCYADALSLVARGAVDVRRLITHRYPLDRSEEAFETSRTAAGNAIKVMIKCQDFA
ncbi:hypothetical protein BOX15_Mlig001464g1, partial [Macrostomum lignano]